MTFANTREAGHKIARILADMERIQFDPEATADAVMIALERYSAHVSAAYPVTEGPPETVLRPVLLHLQDMITRRL